MNLIDKAHLIQDIQHTLRTIDNKQLPLIDQAKALHHLKDVLMHCKKDILQQQQHVKTIEQDIQTHIINCLKLSEFKKTYRGLFYTRELLLQGLNENPQQGWAILHDQTKETWQVWVIPQALKGAIHCSWKNDLTQAYTWLLQQQKLLNCLVIDTQYQQPSTPQTVIHLLGQEGFLSHLHMQPPLYRVDFLDHATQQPHLEWFTQTKDLDQIQNNPIFIAEKLNQDFEFMGYMVILGIQDRHQVAPLFLNYCQQFNFKINSAKTLPFHKFLPHIYTTEQLFECYKTARTIIPSREQVEFIPKNLLSLVQLVSFHEETANKMTPVILLKEQQHHRVIHGQNRLHLAKDESFVPYKIFTREQGISWQKLQETLQTLPEPINANTLHQVLSHN